MNASSVPRTHKVVLEGGERRRSLTVPGVTQTCTCNLFSPDHFARLQSPDHVGHHPLNAGAPQVKSHFLQPCANQPFLAGLSGPDF